MKTKVVAIHLLNDYSGSPFVLRQSLEALVKQGHKVELYTAGNAGFLSAIDGVTIKPIFYQWNKNKLITLFSFLFSQASLFFKLLINLNKSDVVYVNSLLPFGAALAAKLRGCKVLYHIHEVSIRPAALKSFLLGVANHTADTGIFVSNDLAERTEFTKTGKVVYNSLPAAFIETAKSSAFDADVNSFNILMACSLKAYKGVFEFLACAEKLPRFKFMLVLNSSNTEIKSFFKGHEVPANVTLYAAQKNMHPFYSKAKVVMNLSRPTEWVETFGMTILEAMYYKKPVIVPPVGGIAEIVNDGVEGFHINSNDTNEICTCLVEMAVDKELYKDLSAKAYKRAQEFSQEAFSAGIIGAVERLSGIEQTAEKTTAFTYAKNGIDGKVFQKIDKLKNAKTAKPLLNKQSGVLAQQ
jgi:glycosyltransferase involved in cell wall biosynthesis